LRGLPNVGLTPHLGGPTTDRRRDAGSLAVDNLRAYSAGEPLEAVVTPSLFDQIT
ncbi:MAG: D-3-phosphoglycerate dehydrogenase, partial [Rhodospirillales bacterium]|nr:D-3-phosphoglycerate dehydrogenase [Rhodospirillales bacterium]